MKSVDTKPGTNTIRIEAPHLLLVEGKDEELFFRALVDQRLASGAAKPQVIQLGGKDRFGHQLRGVAPDIRDYPVVSVGVVRDADEHPTGALHSVCDALGAAGFPIPASHGEVVGTGPRVGVFVMPDGQSPGALEALCRGSVEQSPAGSCVGQYLDCLHDRDSWGRETTRNAAQRDKAFAHAYLASRKDPVARVGEGAQQGVWDFGHRAFQPLIEFLLQLATGTIGDALSQR